jgi:hypothetical protein
MLLIGEKQIILRGLYQSLLFSYGDGFIGSHISIMKSKHIDILWILLILIILAISMFLDSCKKHESKVSVTFYNLTADTVFVQGGNGNSFMILPDSSSIHNPDESHMYGYNATYLLFHHLDTIINYTDKVETNNYIFWKL